LDQIPFNGVVLMVVSQRLRHSQPSITLDVYGPMIPSLHREIADLMDEITKPRKMDINV